MTPRTRRMMPPRMVPPMATPSLLSPERLQLFLHSGDKSFLGTDIAGSPPHHCSS